MKKYNPKVKRNLYFSLLSISFSIAFSENSMAKDYFFDSTLLEGSGISADLSRLNDKGLVLNPGSYNLDLYVNGNLVKENTSIKFIPMKNEAGNNVQPCLSIEDVRLISLKYNEAPEAFKNEKCVSFDALSKSSSWRYDQPTQKLEFIIPQSQLNMIPRGTIPIDKWDSGIGMFFIKHTTNYYETKTNGNYNAKNIWSGLTGGTNIGLWQLRNQSHVSYADYNGSKFHRWSNIRTYVQRPIPQISSVATLGDSYTNSSLFGSLSFTGVKLLSDSSMYPQTRTGYAPEVRGVASTTARVVIRQLGKVVYETVVPPGAFVIDDLNNTSGQGDLQVAVIDATGKESTFTVPYSAVSNSIRPGMWNYDIALGRVRNYDVENNEFLETVIQRGLNNRFTVNTGVRIAKDYEAYLLGGIMATDFGAFGINSIYSDAKVENNERQKGWRGEASYSRTFSEGTNINLAAYRYSTKGFRDLQDVLGTRKYSNNGDIYYSDTLNQKNQLSATVSQFMGNYGSVSLNASTSDYYNNKSRITQLQFGYSNSYNNIAYNFNVGRQRTSYSARNNFYDYNHDNYNERDKYTENTISLSVSMPFDFKNTRSNVSLNYSSNKNSETATTALSGTVGDNSDLSYSIFSGVDKYNNQGSDLTWGGTLQNQTAKGSYRTSYSQGNNYKQFGLGTSGTLVLHSEGITYGPYASETFALIKAKGASGALIKNGQGAKIDNFGYAIMPSLTPYRYNNISLDPTKMSNNVELDGGSKRVVPYSGSVLRVEFKTISGRPVLINSTLKNHEVIPMGAEVTDRDGKNIGIVGQAGQIYARLGDASGVLFVSWGKGSDNKCKIIYQLPKENDANNIMEFNSLCIKE